MKHIPGIIIGITICVLGFAFHTGRDVEAAPMCVKPYKIDYHIDWSSVDDIGLKHLSVDDLVEVIENE